MSLFSFLLDTDDRYKGPERRGPDRDVLVPVTLGGVMDPLTRLANDQEAHFPTAEWMAAFNKELRDETTATLAAIEAKIDAEDAAAEAAVLDVIPPTPLVFAPHAPNCFFEAEGGVVYRGQEVAKRRIDTYIGALGTTRPRFKTLVSGPAGLGKTALMWITAKRIMDQRAKLGLPVGRFFEILPAQIENKAQLDAFMQGLQSGDVVFFDEIHIIGDVVGEEPFYHVLADTGAPRYPLGNNQGWVEVPPDVSWLAATTDPGKLTDAMRRRLEPEIRLASPTVEDLAAIVRAQDVPVDADAALMMGRRSGGLPWQALNVYHEASAIAGSLGYTRITADITIQAFEAMGIDQNGLLPDDRDVIRVLLSVSHTMASGKVVHRMSETALCAAAGVDVATYARRVKVRLLRGGYITSVGGQTLTEKAVQDYADVLGPA